MSAYGDVSELEEIQDQLRELAARALRIAQDYGQGSCSRAYWYAQIEMARTNDHDYLGGAGYSIGDLIEYIRDEC